MDDMLQVMGRFMDGIIEELGFYGAIITSEEGLVILNSSNVHSVIEIESFTEEISRIVRSLKYPESILVEYSDKKVYVQKYLTEAEAILFLITIFPVNMPHFRDKSTILKKKVLMVI